jgi:hypothetical protein
LILSGRVQHKERFAGEPLQKMKDSVSNEQAEDLYRSDGYLDHDPSLHEEDSPWKMRSLSSARLWLRQRARTLRFTPWCLPVGEEWSGD